ncbi:MAG: MMPL family transporter [Sedimentisphaerales bacterium]|jgi:predicted RND superfamily exporter protein|nr:MMPL family transporter [Sedimentisphaerales bacterium]
MEFGRSLTGLALDRPRAVAIVLGIITVGLGTLIGGIKVDTDPENMLPAQAPVRVFHDQAKRTFGLSDMVVLGVVNKTHPNGVFNVASLNRIYQIAEYLKSWHSTRDPNEGVVGIDLIAPSALDHISQAGPGQIRFEWLMSGPVSTEQEADQIKQKVMSNPLLVGTMVSEDGRALCLFIPITSKTVSHELYKDLTSRLETSQEGDQYFITGLAVAEDTFGHEMFVQMAISAPLAMFVIFLLKWTFFRKLGLIIAPMIVALVAVLTTMGLLIGLGFPVHIMSSMIPIFLMPISVTDSVHILSAFFDRYTHEKGRRQTIAEMMSELHRPMLFTSLTTAAGFLSLALTPIPPVQVFGVFVAIGVMIAWVVTVIFIPAYVMLLSERYLLGFGAAAVDQEVGRQGLVVRFLGWMGSFTCTAARPIVICLALLCCLGVYGMTKITVNDNPTKWFSTRHPIRQADIELNKHFGGTYMAYLVLEDAMPSVVDDGFISGLASSDMARPEVVRRVIEQVSQEVDPNTTRAVWLETAIERANTLQAQAGPDDADALARFVESLEELRRQEDTFQQPSMLHYVSSLEAHLVQSGLVGKVNALPDVVKKVYQELTGGDPNNFRIPDTDAAVAQCLIQYQSSHRPQDLWHFVTPDYKQTNIWLQLPSGDNKDMEKVVRAVDLYLADHPPPVTLRYHWAGLTFINMIWQEQMVRGMVMSLLGSFAIVFMMMVILFRSALWGLLCMVPLSMTIVIIYGVIGLSGKDYDMPVAVLSALTLGMAVDFAIHFLERARTSYQQAGSWVHCSISMFQEPARAITRNVIVIAVGFLPLLVAPLVPYKTVGILMCAILAMSGLVTLVALPAILTLIENWAFRPGRTPVAAACNCGTCIAAAIGTVVVVVLNFGQAAAWSVGRIIWVSIVGIIVVTAICRLVSMRPACVDTQPDGAASDTGSPSKEA